MRAFGKTRGCAWLALAELLYSGAIPGRVFADEKDTGAQSAKTETANASEAAQAPANNPAPGNNQGPERPALPAPVDGVCRGPHYPRPTPHIPLPTPTPPHPLT